ncbi:MAG: iron-containing alcohol dehydrogenase [Gammaproteobacteria bacterium]|uniref:Putative alcohol dehydrogenase n=1 Tax=viral metagenome TaxID=1070528 RepID=A0A6M3XF95_9ZZZZ|nr:iron-containing alcohol dehydrogenase [Gammaproteobacteria bacterium]MBU2236436.1 iron-containing alcohol dehydrogenase [Gammaproteobacteria bacterium]MBU2320916.1 iron-containing alcohol dehydrogenase [Gammaproteobacteria bacterium]MBU2411512.1 iron-containing alcohol dehydrogenase [Gammaproteobacteria bacterium]
MLKLRFPLPVFRNALEIANGKNSRMALKGINANRAAIIISTSFKSSVYYDQVIRLIGTQSVKVIEKSWQGEPTVENLSIVIKELESFQPDYIIALGGGSVIDGAKIAWLLYECPTLSLDDLYRPFSLPTLRGRAKFAAIPTTIGSGSEVSSAAVMFDGVSNSKKAVVTHDFLPDLVILDPELVAEVPNHILKATVADALSHAVEGYVSKIYHPLMNSFAEQAVSIIYRYKNQLDRESWDIQMISDLQHAAMLAGWVQNHCVVGLSHAIAHQLGSFNIPHGLANGLLMPKVIEFNSNDNTVAEKYEKLARNANMVSSSDLSNLFTILVSNQKIMLSFTDNELDMIACNALLDPAARTNPVFFTADDVKKVLKKCL